MLKTDISFDMLMDKPSVDAPKAAHEAYTKAKAAFEQWNGGREFWLWLGANIAAAQAKHEYLLRCSPKLYSKLLTVILTEIETQQKGLDTNLDDDAISLLARELHYARLQEKTYNELAIKLREMGYHPKDEKIAH